MFDNSETGEYRGYNSEQFVFDGKHCTVVFPDSLSEGNKWIWRTEFLGAFDSVDTDMLSKGYALAYISVSNMYGHPDAVRTMKKFRDFMTEHGFNEKTVLFGFSRGGLYAFNYALKYPDTVAALYLDAPVLDIKSWPGGLGKGVGAPREFEECLSIYGLDKSSVLSFRQNPSDKLEQLLSLHIPVALVAGDSDRTVPYEENGKLLENTYKNGGGDILCIVKKGCDHHPHSLSDPSPISDFLCKRY
ncbi:MAG: alpha/beta fold hydrolase [Clostridia bacterium]|nr:alpha/beta fold hydrolase [Clostridia bacterium]